MHIGVTGWGHDFASRTHADFVALLMRADELGFDSVWLQELHLEEGARRYPSALLLAAAIAEHTTRMRIGIAVLPLPLHQPLLLAESIAQLDYQSGGRIDVGIGRGSSNQVARMVGVEPEAKRERFLAAYDTLRGVWTGQVVAHAGGLARVATSSPVQQPHPPLYVAGYTRETIEFAVHEDLPLLLSLEPPETRQLLACREICAASASSYDQTRHSLNRYVCIGASETEVDRLVDTLLPRLHERRRKFATRRGEDPDTLVPRKREDFLREQAVAGTPGECVRQLEALARELGTFHVRCVFNGNGVLSDAETLAGMELFAKEALPTCRAIGKEP
jgi:alkanesulfonate monooxygenase SsuD/methylene tetrahydromethanopterin reductase-like flavin-dependent oxidoreductase (luciferase family)